VEAAGAATVACASDADSARRCRRTPVRAPHGKQWLHQATFREALFSAYVYVVPWSGLMEPMPLDAAHIVADPDEKPSTRHAERHPILEHS
jgi:hypothetical protein